MPFLFEKQAKKYDALFDLNEWILWSGVFSMISFILCSGETIFF